MNVLDILEENCVALDLEIADKSELVSKLVDLLESAGVVTDREEVVQRVLEREKLMSTGIGGGVAIPHAQCRGASKLAIALARTKDGVEFDALDGKPVRLFFMIIGPEEKGGYVRIDPKKCTSCRLCIPVCPYGGIRFHEDTGALICIQCGNCVEVCPVGALEMANA